MTRSTLSILLGVQKVHFAANLKSYMEKRGLTTRGLAERLGVDKQTVTNWRMGHNEPQATNIPALERVLGIGLAELCLREPEGACND